MLLTRDQIILIYQRAIDNSVGAGEGEAWWKNVQAELEAVIMAPTTAAAAEVIAWWHQVWRHIWTRTTGAPTYLTGFNTRTCVHCPATQFVHPN